MQILFVDKQILVHEKCQKTHVPEMNSNLPWNKSNVTIDDMQQYLLKLSDISFHDECLIIHVLIQVVEF